MWLPANDFLFHCLKYGWLMRGTHTRLMVLMALIYERTSSLVVSRNASLSVSQRFILWKQIGIICVEWECGWLPKEKPRRLWICSAVGDILRERGDKGRPVMALHVPVRNHPPGSAPRWWEIFMDACMRDDNGILMWGRDYYCTYKQWYWWDLPCRLRWLALLILWPPLGGRRADAILYLYCWAGFGPVCDGWIWQRLLIVLWHG